MWFVALYKGNVHVSCIYLFIYSMLSPYLIAPFLCNTNVEKDYMNVDDYHFSRVRSVWMTCIYSELKGLISAKIVVGLLFVISNDVAQE